MRIVHVLKHARRGNGSVHVAVDLACEQVKRGHEVWLVSAGGSYDDLLRREGVRVHQVPESAGIVDTIRCLVELAVLTLRVRPHVLHAHMMSSAVLAAVIATLTRRVLVATMHNSFDKHSGLMRVARVVVAVSRAERSLLLERGYRPSKVAVVLNGTRGSARESLDREDIGPLQRPSVMVLSGMHGRKAVDDAIRAFALAAADRPEWHLNIVGGGPDLAKLERLAHDLQVDGAVHFLGSTLTPMPLLETSEIFITATLADPCPLNVMEARSAGCAIVGTRVGGIPEVLDEGRAGQLVPPRDPAAMAAVLERLMQSPEELQEWRTASLRGADYYSVARMTLDYDAVYAAVIGHR